MLQLANSCMGTQELAHWNKLYEERFGHLFIICARGKPASVMLAALKSRCVTCQPSGNLLGMLRLLTLPRAGIRTAQRRS